MGSCPTCQQWLICSHQWCLAATSCPGTSTAGNQLWLSEMVPWSPPDYWGTTLWNGPVCLIDGSGWSSLRSLNLCRPLPLDCCGSKSQVFSFRFEGSCAGTGWMADWADWAGTEGSDWTWPLDPRTRACWATLVQSVWFCCMGSPVTSPPLCPRWLLVGRHMGPDPPRTDWVYSLSMPWCLELVTQTVAVCCWTWWQTSPLGAGATGSIWLRRPLGEGTTLVE